MARPVVVRERYIKDRGLLLRLELAVDKDTRLSGEQKSAVIGQIQALSSMLTELDRSISNAESDGDRASKRRRAAQP